MTRPLIGLLLFIGLHYADGLQAHMRSESFSRWQYAEQTLSLRFTVNTREATRIPRSQNTNTLSQALADYLESHIVIGGADSNCRLFRAFQPLTARPGYLQIEGIWRCNEPPESLGIHAFFDLAAEHSHFASFESSSGKTQQLMTVETPVWQLGTTKAIHTEITGSTFFDYVRHGFRHITSGLDHVLFLIALLLICRRTRDLVWAITGFTLGHSITLTLSVVGSVQANIPAIEAIIGLTIALVAVERAARSMASALTLAALCALLLLVMMLFSGLYGGNLGAAVLGGLALFTFCYLLMAHDLTDNGSYRLIMTTLFGLVHGFGFASGFLAGNAGFDVLPRSLAGFNIGVELGQLALLGAMLMIGLLVRRQTRVMVPAADLVSAIVCGFGVFWFVQRGLW
jgi:hypothetical protein